MIELKNVAIGYDKGNPIATELNLQFEKNKIYCILGASGRGKTTLLKTISGLIKPLSGEVWIDGEKLGKSVNKKVYMMHQNYTCFDWLSCLNNVLITQRVKNRNIADEDIRRAIEALQSVNLGGNEKKYPTQLSGGMRQRLALARTMFVKPEIILMDEPLSALDEKTRKDMQRLIMHLHKETGNTIIMITHSQDEAYAMSDYILDMDKKISVKNNQKGVDL